MNKWILIILLTASCASYALTNDEIKHYDLIVMFLGDKNPNRLKEILKVYNNLSF